MQMKISLVFRKVEIARIIRNIKLYIDMSTSLKNNENDDCSMSRKETIEWTTRPRPPGYVTTNADAGVGIDLKKGDSEI